MKRLLIISPYFPPSNTADMQRVRMSLSYFNDNGWEAEVVVVDDKYSEVVKDELLLQSIPASIKIHTVQALSKRWTSKIGLGSLGLRALWYYKKKVNNLLSSEKYDLIYFSTTQFPVCVLGAYWKKKFGVPYAIDMQDPWHSTYYQDKPKTQRPPKYWFMYRMHKYLEPVAMNSVDGLISVSEAYIDQLKSRYAQIENIPTDTITFGYCEADVAVALQHQQNFAQLLSPDNINIVYVGRGGADMHKAIIPVFKALQAGSKENNSRFEKLKFFFIGTSYAQAGTGIPSIIPLARQYGVEQYVVEITNRISYYHALATLQKADALFIPGSDDANYTASKLYPYLLVKKPLLAIFHPQSSVVEVLTTCTNGSILLTFTDDEKMMADKLSQTLTNWSNRRFEAVIPNQYFEHYSSQNTTRLQTQLFDKILERTHSNA